MSTTSYILEKLKETFKNHKEIFRKLENISKNNFLNFEELLILSE